MANTNTIKSPRGSQTARTAKRIAALEALMVQQTNLLNLAHDSIIVMNMDETIRFWNRGAEQRYGWSADEAGGQVAHTLLQTVFPQPREEIRAELLRVGYWEGELVHTTRAGQRIVVASRWALQRDAQGDPAAILEINNDITERKQAEQVLAYQAALVDHASDAIISSDENYIIRTWNPAAEALYGWNAEEVIGKPSSAVLPVEIQTGEDRQAAARDFMEKGIWRGEVTYQRKDGSQVHTFVSSVALRDSQGHINGALAIHTDITERKQTEEALRRRTEELQAVMEAVPTAVFITRDPDAHTITGNRAAREMVELPPSANISKSAPNEERPTGWQEMRNGLPVPPQDLPMQRAVRGHEVRDYEMDLVFRDGTVKSVVGHATPIRDEKGSPQGGIAVLIDVTEHKRAENSLREALQRIEHLNRELEERAQDLEMTSEELRVTNDDLLGANERLEIAKSNLETALAQEHTTRVALEATNQELEAVTYAVAHDLRGPLNQVHQLVQLVQDDYGAQLPETGQHLLRLVEENAQVVNRLAEDLLTLARLTQQSPVKQRIAMTELVRQVVNELCPKASPGDAAGHRVDIHMGELPAAEADPRWLQQVWEHLLSNAVKFTRTREKAQIDIGSSDQDGQAIYWIRDNGVGFDMAHVDRLFRAFQRLHHVEDFEGNGLGLAIVERIIRWHGGRVWAQAEPDQGATFYFTVGGR